MRQVLLISDEDSVGYTVEVPSLPGCISQGDTLEEALANIREAIDLYIEVVEKCQRIMHRSCLRQYDQTADYLRAWMCSGPATSRFYREATNRSPYYYGT